MELSVMIYPNISKFIKESSFFINKIKKLQKESMPEMVYNYNKILI